MPVKQADLQSLVETHYPRIFRASLMMTGNRWDADDLAQETFLEALRSWRRFSGQSKVETWLYAILLNQHRKRMRSGRRRWQRWLRWLEGNRPPCEERPETLLQQNEWRRTLWSAVAKLPPAQQHAVVLRYSEDLSYEEIARAMNCPVGTVKSRLHHALAALKGAFSHELEMIDLQPAAIQSPEPLR